MHDKNKERSLFSYRWPWISFWIISLKFFYFKPFVLEFAWGRTENSLNIVFADDAVVQSQNLSTLQVFLPSYFRCILHLQIVKCYFSAGLNLGGNLSLRRRVRWKRQSYLLRDMRGAWARWWGLHLTTRACYNKGSGPATMNLKLGFTWSQIGFH